MFLATVTAKVTPMHNRTTMVVAVDMVVERQVGTPDLLCCVLRARKQRI